MSVFIAHGAIVAAAAWKISGAQAESALFGSQLAVDVQVELLERGRSGSNF